MRIEVDKDRCIGSGNCVEMAPRYFDQRDSDGVVEVLEQEVSLDDETSVREAADICPVAAILFGADARTSV
jgi:ferredoxin